MARIEEFLEVDGVFAMRNLTILITIVIGSIIVLELACVGELTGEIFAIYMLSGGGVYGFGKWQDEKTKRGQIDAEAEPAIVPQSVTTINQPDSVNVAGDAKIKGKKK